MICIAFFKVFTDTIASYSLSLKKLSANVIRKIQKQPRVCNFIKNETVTMVFSYKFCEILRTPFLQNTKKFSNMEKFIIYCFQNLLFWYFEFQKVLIKILVITLVSLLQTKIRQQILINFQHATKCIEKVEVYAL